MHGRSHAARPSVARRQVLKPRAPIPAPSISIASRWPACPVTSGAAAPCPGCRSTVRRGRSSGCSAPTAPGKSTLLSVLATLAAPSAGSVRYGAATAGDAGAALRAHIGFLSHDLQLYPELSARENLEFFAGLHGLDDPRRQAADALVRAGLDDRGDDVVEGFSRGMRQRLALERALPARPAPGVCSTSRSRGWTRRRAADWSSGCGPCGPTGGSSSSPPTTSTSSTALLDRGAAAAGGQVAAPRRRGDPARAVPGRGRGGRRAMSEFLRVAWLVVRKDLRVESRSRELLFTTVFFAISCVLVFSFGFVRGGRAVEGAAAGILWIAHRLLRHSRPRPRLRARAAPRRPAGPPARAGRPSRHLRRQARRSADAPRGGGGDRDGHGRVPVPGPAVPASGAALRAAVAGDPGVRERGDAVSAMLVRARSRAVLLPVLLYPITIPVRSWGSAGPRCSSSPSRTWRWPGSGSACCSSSTRCS